MKTLTRRSFLATSSAALAAPMIVPSSVFGQNAPSNRVHLAAVGVGNRGAGNCGNFFSYADTRFVAAVDCFRDRRERFAARANEAYGADICKPFADVREVLARDDVDGIVVSTPDHWHVPMALMAARAKKDMYVEKPLGIAMSWAWKLRDEVTKNGVIFQYGTQQRSGRWFRKACELVRNGYIGEVQRVDAWCPDMSSQFNQASKPPYGSTEEAPVPDGFDYDTWLGPAPVVPYTADRCSCFGAYHIYDYALGFIAGWGAHPLDIAQWGLGMDASGPVRYEASGTLPPEGSLWNTTESWDVHAEYADGVRLRFMGHRVGDPLAKKHLGFIRGHGTTFHGTEGWVSVDRSHLYSPDNHALRDVVLKDSDDRLYESPSQTRNFVDCIKSRRPTINPLETAIRSDTISHLSDIAIRLGRVVKWDPATEAVIDDAEAEAMLSRPMRPAWAV